jgi:hypothetical protein
MSPRQGTFKVLKRGVSDDAWGFSTQLFCIIKGSGYVCRFHKSSGSPLEQLAVSVQLYELLPSIIDSPYTGCCALYTKSNIAAKRKGRRSPGQPALDKIHYC